MAYKKTWSKKVELFYLNVFSFFVSLVAPKPIVQLNVRSVLVTNAFFPCSTLWYRCIVERLRGFRAKSSEALLLNIAVKSVSSRQQRGGLKTTFEKWGAGTESEKLFRDESLMILMTSLCWPYLRACRAGVLGSHPMLKEHSKITKVSYLILGC